MYKENWRNMYTKQRKILIPTSIRKILGIWSIEATKKSFLKDLFPTLVSGKSPDV